MAKKINTIGISKVKNNIGNAGVGFVVIPESIEDITTYVEDCYRTNTITIYGGRGYGYFSNIYVDQDVMQNIHFPEDPTVLNRGSAVVWVKDDNSQRPIVIASIRKEDEFMLSGQNQYKISRKRGNRIVELAVDANESEYLINIIGDAEQPAEMKIKLVSENSNSKMQIVSDNVIELAAKNKAVVTTDNEIDLRVRQEGILKGRVKYKLGEGFNITSEKQVSLVLRDEEDEDKTKISYTLEEGLVYEDEFKNKITITDGKMEFITAEDKCVVKYEKGSGLEYKDEFGNELKCTSSGIEEKGTTIKHNNGSKSMVLGEDLVQLLNTLCTILTSAQVITPVGPGTLAPPTITQITTQVQSKLNTMLSQKSKLE